MKKKYELAENYPVLLTVGEIKERKGQLITLQAVRLLKKDYLKIKYVIVEAVGDSSYVSKIRNYAAEHNLADNFEIVSDARDDRVISFFYDKCDVFLLNSISTEKYFEGFGLVLLEAAAFGKPVIGSKDSGTEEVVWDEYNGFTVKQRNPEEVRDRVREILEKSCVILSFKSREFAKRFTWQNTVSAYLSFYKRL